MTKKQTKKAHTTKQVREKYSDWQKQWAKQKNTSNRV